jgi:hypothetical protein
MIWLKSLLVGIAAAIVTFAAMLFLPLMTMMWWADIGEGAGGIGVYWSGVIDLFVLPVIAFALGFWWSVRRARRSEQSAATESG